MSSGTLPLATYHRASQLGSGSFGSVVTVYNDDGEEYALKLFLPDDDDNNNVDNCDSGSDNDSDYVIKKPLGLGVLREISCLRLLRGQHTNIIRMMDIQPEWTDNDEDAVGAGTTGCISMALPMYKNGSLYNSIQRKTLQHYPKKTKIYIAYKLLCAICFLHDNGIIHRDIKCDNILLEESNTDDTLWEPILIDFSLAKPINDTIWNTNTTLLGNTYETTNPTVSFKNISQQLHKNTSDVGTIVYIAPEIINGSETYTLQVDMFSIGVVFLELLQNYTFTAIKNKEALYQINEALTQLPTDVPFPNLIQSLLQHNPNERCTARQALYHPLFTKKFIMTVPPIKLITVATALPHENDDDNDDIDNNDDTQLEEENNSPNMQNQKSNISIMNKNSNGKNNNKKSNDDIKKENRKKFIHKICIDLESTNIWTQHAAYEYSTMLEQLDNDIDVIDKKSKELQSQSLLDCIVLAHKFYEYHLLDLDEIHTNYPKYYSNWSIDEYIDNESSIFMMMDYCLYPRIMQ